MREIQDRVIIDRLKFFNGNRTKAAKSLGISIRNLRMHVARMRDAGNPEPVLRILSCVNSWDTVCLKDPHIVEKFCRQMESYAQ